MPSRRRILVTGASRGIGAAISRRLLTEGCEVVGIARDFTDWDATEERFMPIALDLADLDKLPHQLGEIARLHPAIDGLVLNAGYGRFGSLEEFSYRQIVEMVNMNLLQHLFVARAFLPHIKQHGFGDLVIIGSEAALAGGRRGAVYSACKFALRGFAQSLRQETANSGLRVSLINPGMVDTGFFDELEFAPGQEPSQHLRPSDIADALWTVLSAPAGTVFDEIVLNPLHKVIQFKKRP